MQTVIQSLPELPAVEWTLNTVSKDAPSYSQVRTCPQQRRYFYTYKEPRNRFQGIYSSSLCSLADRYDNPICTRFLAPIDCSELPAQKSFKNYIHIYYITKPHDVHTAKYRYIRSNIHLSTSQIEPFCRKKEQLRSYSERNPQKNREDVF